MEDTAESLAITTDQEEPMMAVSKHEDIMCYHTKTLLATGELIRRQLLFVANAIEQEGRSVNGERTLVASLCYSILRMMKLFPSASLWSKDQVIYHVIRRLPPPQISCRKERLKRSRRVSKSLEDRGPKKLITLDNSILAAFLKNIRLKLCQFFSLCNKHVFQQRLSISNILAQVNKEIIWKSPRAGIVRLR